MRNVLKRYIIILLEGQWKAGLFVKYSEILFSKMNICPLLDSQLTIDNIHQYWRLTCYQFYCQIWSLNLELIVVLYFQLHVIASKKPFENNNDIHNCLVPQFHLGGVLLYKFIIWIILNHKKLKK